MTAGTQDIVDIGRRRWLMLGLGTLAQTASCAFLYGLPYLLPMIRRTEHLSLAQGGALVAAPTIGVIFALIPWGAAADRFGERIVMAIGLGMAGALLLLARTTHGIWGLGILLALAGIGGASVNAASGRVVLGWFPAHQRGLAMGARQMAQPLGLMLAALSLPPIANHGNYRAALIALGAFALLTATLVAVFVVDPVRRAGATTDAPVPSPYRTAAIWRVHGASALLVIPQFLTSAFAMEYLVSERDWSATHAGRLLAIVQLCGALGRLGVGVWSDRVGSRLRPMRQIAVASAVAMLALAAGTAGHSVLAVLALAAASVISVTDNGLGFTATAEMAGPVWAGRALGAQNTGQNIAAFATPPVFGALIGGPGYVTAFVIAACFPALGVLSVPVRSGEARGDRGNDGGVRRTGDDARRDGPESERLPPGR